MTTKTETTHYLQCDACSTRTMPQSSEGKAVRTAMRLGWLLGWENGQALGVVRDLCRGCRDSEAGRARGTALAPSSGLPPTVNESEARQAWCQRCEEFGK